MTFLPVQRRRGDDCCRQTVHFVLVSGSLKTFLSTFYGPEKKGGTLGPALRH